MTSSVDEGGLGLLEGEILCERYRADRLIERGGTGSAEEEAPAETAPRAPDRPRGRTVVLPLWLVVLGAIALVIVGLIVYVLMRGHR